MRIKKLNENEREERLRKWVAKLSYEDRLLIRDCIFRLYSVSEDMRIEGKK